MRIGITGHRGLTPRTVELVRSEFVVQLAETPGVTPCISCAAEGADQLVACANQLNVPVNIIWPPGSARASLIA